MFIYSGERECDLSNTKINDTKSKCFSESKILEIVAQKEKYLIIIRLQPLSIL